MILPKNPHLDPDLKKELKAYVYDVIGCAMDVCRQLPCCLPEYIYQEAFAKLLYKKGFNAHKEWRHSPMFEGEKLNTYLKMDFMIERSRGNIIVEAKALETLTNKERGQLFGYMVATGYPIGLLINFATYPHPIIERYYFDKKNMTMTAF